ncbi:MAG: DMT family transporter [Roseovarius sp.]
MRMMHPDRLAVFAGLFAGLCFGIFWLPLRMLEQGGLEAPWALALFMVIPAVMCLPVAWHLRRDYLRGGRALIGGVLAGAAYAMYAASLLYTDVVRAVLLFYLMPIWGFALGWIILGDRITRSRWLAIGLGVVGMVVIFADDTGLPLPRNLGDWLGLASGMFWAVGCMLILNESRVRTATHGVSFFLVGAGLTVAVALWSTSAGHVQVPDAGALKAAALWFLPVALVLILPAGFATVYAPTRLNPGVVGLLFMTEIAVAAVTAAIWSGERFGIREVIGLPLILSAGLIEPAVMTWRDRRARVERTA